AMSADPKYAVVDPANVRVTNIDNETPGFEVTPLDVVTRENGQTVGTFTMRLRSRPTADVTVGISSSGPGEVVPSVSSLVFTPGNWSGTQTVTVTGVDDDVADGEQPYTIVTASATSDDLTYRGRNPDDVSAVNVDNDSAGITVTQGADTETTELGGTAEFSIVLNSQPTADVAIPLSSSRPGEGQPACSPMVFTPDNWDSPQIVTVTGVDDFIADGDQPYTIQTGEAMSADPGYHGINASDPAFTNLDNESAGFELRDTAGLTVTEAG